MSRILEVFFGSGDVIQQVEEDEYYPQESGSSVRPVFIAKEDNVPLTYLPTGTSHGPIDAWGQPAEMPLSDSLIDRLWEKMYSQPVLVRCPHCDSVNVVTSPTCIQCGAPMGKAKRIGK